MCRYLKIMFFFANVLLMWYWGCVFIMSEQFDTQSTVGFWVNKSQLDLKWCLLTFSFECRKFISFHVLWFSFQQSYPNQEFQQMINLWYISSLLLQAKIFWDLRWITKSSRYYLLLKGIFSCKILSAAKCSSWLMVHLLWNDNSTIFIFNFKIILISLIF